MNLSDKYTIDFVTQYCFGGESGQGRINVDSAGNIGQGIELCTFRFFLKTTLGPAAMINGSRWIECDKVSLSGNYLNPLRIQLTY